MKKKRHTVEQIIRILREADSGLRNDEVCLMHNISQQTFYRWKRKYEGMTWKRPSVWVILKRKTAN